MYYKASIKGTSGNFRDVFLAKFPGHQTIASPFVAPGNDTMVITVLGDKMTEADHAEEIVLPILIATIDEDYPQHNPNNVFFVSEDIWEDVLAEYEIPIDAPTYSFDDIPRPKMEVIFQSRSQSLGSDYMRANRAAQNNMHFMCEIPDILKKLNKH